MAICQPIQNVTSKCILFCIILTGSKVCSIWWLSNHATVWNACQLEWIKSCPVTWIYSIFWLNHRPGYFYRILRVVKNVYWLWLFCRVLLLNILKLRNMGWSDITLRTKLWHLPRCLSLNSTLNAGKGITFHICEIWNSLGCPMGQSFWTDFKINFTNHELNGRTFVKRCCSGLIQLFQIKGKSKYYLCKISCLVTHAGLNMYFLKRGWNWIVQLNLSTSNYLSGWFPIVTMSVLLMLYLHQSLNFKVKF